MAKLLAHYELYKMIIDKPGDIIEMGVFKGASLLRWVKFRNIFENSFSRKIVGFDIFGEFPEAEELDKMTKDKFTSMAGTMSISLEYLEIILSKLNLRDNVYLVKGDITETLDLYLEEHPQTKVSLLHIDVDLQEPTRMSLEKLSKHMIKGGVIVFDDYGYFPGTNSAVDKYINERNIQINKLPFVHTPSYVVL